MSRFSTPSRRELIGRSGMLAAASLAGPAAARAAADAVLGTGHGAPLTPTSDPADPAAATALAALERSHGLRIGLHAVNHRTGHSLGYRADEHFAFCSVYKAPLVAHLLHLHGRDTAYLNRVVRYDTRDLIEGDFVTRLFTSTGMTVRALCQAALAYSDNVAANLLFRLTGGPAQLTGYLRSLGDTVTGCERTEPSVNTAVPGQLRDTASPRAIGADFTRLLLGDALRDTERAQLRFWLEGDEVNIQRFRAGLPQNWSIADKTGTGFYGVANDVGVVWTADGTPLTLAVMTTAATRDAAADQAAVAAAARIAATRVAPAAPR